MSQAQTARGPVEAGALGVSAIVDPTAVGLGRYIPRITKIAEQEDVQIVVATGPYTYGDVPFFFQHRGSALEAALGTPVPDPMVEMFVNDIRERIAGTGVRAGMLNGDGCVDVTAVPPPVAQPPASPTTRHLPAPRQLFMLCKDRSSAERVSICGGVGGGCSVGPGVRCRWPDARPYETLGALPASASARSLDWKEG